MENMRKRKPTHVGRLKWRATSHTFSRVLRNMAQFDMRTHAGLTAKPKNTSADRPLTATEASSEFGMRGHTARIAMQHRQHWRSKRLCAKEHCELRTEDCIATPVRTSTWSKRFWSSAPRKSSGEIAKRSQERSLSYAQTHVPSCRLEFQGAQACSSTQGRYFHGTKFQKQKTQT